MAKNKKYWKTLLASSADKKHAATTGEDPLIGAAQSRRLHFQQNLSPSADRFFNLHHLIIVRVILGAVKNDCFHLCLLLSA